SKRTRQEPCARAAPPPHTANAPSRRPPPPATPAQRRRPDPPPTRPAPPHPEPARTPSAPPHATPTPQRHDCHHQTTRPPTPPATGPLSPPPPTSPPRPSPPPGESCVTCHHTPYPISPIAPMYASGTSRISALITLSHARYPGRLPIGLQCCARCAHTGSA